jgi:membrane protein required for colicin V production
MTPLIFDLIIVGAVLLSIGIGWMRGFCNEVFTIFGWIAAIVATIYFTPVVLPLAKSHIHKEWLAPLVASSVIFLVTLAVCSAISYVATKTLHASKLGLVDRILGFCFGILRAIVLLGLGYLLFTYVFKAENQPDFVTKSRTKPFLEASAAWIQTVVPLNSTLGTDDKTPEQDKDKDLKQSIPQNNKLGEPPVTETPKEEPTTPTKTPGVKPSE